MQWRRVLLCWPLKRFQRRLNNSGWVFTDRAALLDSGRRALRLGDCCTYFWIGFSWRYWSAYLEYAGAIRSPPGIQQIVLPSAYEPFACTERDTAVSTQFDEDAVEKRFSLERFYCVCNLGRNRHSRRIKRRSSQGFSNRATRSGPR